MRKFYLRCFIVLAFVFLSVISFAQVDVTASGGTPNASYTTLKGAFDAINAGTHTGTITIGISGNTTEAAVAAAASVVLNSSGTGSASYTSITISPTGGAARTITGAATAGFALIDLNGADNVTIDGLNSGGNSLTIANTTVSATAGTSTIRFVADATNNLITKCSLQGSATMAVGTTGGVVYFAAGAIASGNDNNTVSFCDIGPAGAGLPTKGIFSSGTTTTTTTYNSGNQILNNNIFNCFIATTTSAGVYLGGGNIDWTISNNKIYQTAARTQTTGAVHAGIQLASTNINNCTISGNTIGFADANGTGVYTLIGASSSSRFYPIYLSSHGTTTATTIQNNTIKSISLSGPVSGTTTSAPFAGIMIASGLATIDGNTIGEQATTGNIIINSSATATGEVYGIQNAGSSTSIINNNNIGSFTIQSSSTGAGIFFGIRSNTASTAGVTSAITNNLVGGTVAGSITNSNAATGSRILGILHELSTPTITGNTVRNMTMLAANTGTTTSASVIGISQTATANSDYTISNNTIHSLSNTNASAAVSVFGIRYTGPITGTNVIEKNFVHSLGNSSTSATADLRGIIIAGGTSNIQNNMVRIGINETGASLTGGIIVYGIYDNNTVATGNNYYFNTVYVGGTGVDGAVNTYAFRSDGTTNTRDFRNNIFHNARSNGAGTGIHYAIHIGGSGINPTGLTSNNNDLRADGTGGVLGFYDLSDRIDLSAWSGATGQDGSSISETPDYVNETGTAATVSLKINTATPTSLESGGVSIAGITTDFENDTRGTPPDIGADEFAGTSPTCSGTPAASNTLVNVSLPACRDADFTLSLSTTYNAVDYQWQSSPDNTNWTDIPGATFSTLVTSATTSTWYRARITCPASGLSTNSTSIQVTTVTALNGVYTINNTQPTSGTNYNNFIDAVADLNCRGINGDVTFNISAGQVFASNDSLNITATGTALDTIAFVKSGAGANPKIRRLGNAGTSNYILRIGGGDYFTFNGIDFEQTGTSAVDWVEIAISIQNTSGTTGATNNTFLNGVVTMTDANNGSKGVYIQAAITPTAASGNNNFNRFLNMTVQNSYEGYRITGATNTFPDNGNEINNYQAGTSRIQNLGNGTATGSLYGVFATYQSNFKVLNTEIADLTPGGTSLAYGIALQTSTANSAEFGLNHIHNIAGGGTVNGINITSGDTASVYFNRIHDLSTTATAGTLRGIDIGGTGLGSLTAANLIYSLSSTGITGTTVVGIEVGTGNVHNIVNNMISGLTAPSSTSTTGGTKGIAVSSGSSGNPVRIANNTVLLNDVGAVASYSSAGISNSSTTPILDIRNNIIINNSNVTTGTRAVAFWKTAATDNVDNNSNNNLYYAGTPGAKNLIYYDGTTSAQTIAAYKTLPAIAPAENLSVTENVSFLPIVLGIIRPNPAVPTLVESSGQVIPEIPIDFELNLRGPYPLAGQVNGGGFAPDLGADEGDFTYIVPPVPDCPTLDEPANGATICSYSPLSLSWTPAGTGGLPTGGYDVYFGTNPTPPLVINTSATNYTPPTVLPNTVYYWKIVPKNSTGPAVGCTTYSFTTINAVVTSTVPGSRCGTGTVTLGATGGGTLSWYANASGGSVLGTGTSFVTPSISSTTTYYVSSGSGGTTGSMGAPDAGSTGTYTLEAGLLFDVVAASMNLNGVYIYPIGTGAGVVNIELRNSTGTVMQSLAYNGTGTASPGIKTFVPLNWDIPAGTDYFLAMASRTGNISSLIRDLNADIVGGPIATNPSMTLAGVATITSGRLGATGTSTSYYFFYDWQVSTGCESPRSSVIATVNEIPTITPGTNPDVCTGTPTANLPYSAATGSPNQYSINFDAAAEAQGFVDVTNAALPASPIAITVPGAAVVGVYNATLTVRNSLTDCSSTGYPITVTLSTATTPTVSLAANPAGPICAGTNVQFTATASGTGGGVVTYNFKVNTISVQSGASNIFTSTTLVNGDMVQVEINISGGNPCLTSTTASSNTITMVVSAINTPTVSLSANPAGAICAGVSVQFTATAGSTGGGTVAYNFKVNGVSVQNGASNTYTTTTLANADAVTVEITVTGGCVTSTTAVSNTINMIVNPSSTPTVSLVANPSGSVCTGTSVEFTATAGGIGAGTVAYNFKVNGVSVQNSASNIYTTTTLANGDAVTVEITVTGGNCLTSTTAISNTINMVVTSFITPSVTIASNPVSPVCLGASVVFTATATNTGGGTVTYNFKVNGGSVQSGASNTYTTTSLVNGDIVSVDISISGGSSCLTATTASSNNLTMVVNTQFTPTVSIAAIPAGTICAGTSVQFTATASNTGGGTVTYTFKVNGTGVQTGASNTYTTTTLANGDQVTVEISISGGNCLTTTTATSNTITMAVTASNTPTVTIAANPAGPVCAGTSVQFTATSNNTGGGTVTYTFMVNGSSVQSGASNTYTTTTLTNGDLVRVDISVAGGTCMTATTASSSVITMTVNPNLTPTVSIAANPAGSICTGTSVQFTATASNTGGGTVTYTFKVNGGSVQSGASNTYTTTTLVNGDQVTADISISGGNCLSVSTASSNTITMTVTATITPTVSIAANPAGPVCSGTSVQFTATASNTGGGTVNYNFFVNGVSVQNGASNTYTTTTLANGDAVRVDITITGGTCLSSTTATSNIIAMTVTPGGTPTVTIAANPSGPICAGTSVQFTATAGVTGGGTVTYNFQVNAITVQSGASNTYTNAALTNGDVVSVNISIAGGTCISSTTASSNFIIMAVSPILNPGVSIAANPSGAICTGTNVVFTAIPVNTGGGTVSYNFKVNGVSVQLGASSTYSTSTLANGNTVSVEITITGGSCLTGTTATSNVITMTVTPGITPSVVLAATPGNFICNGTTVQFAATASNTGGGAVNYNFRVNGASVQNGSSNTYSSGTLANGNTVSVDITITGGGGCLTSTTASSNTITMNVRPQPTVTLSASPLTSLLPGQLTTLTATPGASAGGSLSTTWLYNGVAAAPPIPGNSYVADVEHLGTYQVLISETYTSPSALVCSGQSQVVTISATASSRLFIFPTPNDGRFTVSYFNNGGTSTERIVVIYDSKGSMVYQRKFPITGPYTLIHIDMQHVNTGIYYVVVGDASGNKLAEGKVHVR